MYFWTKCEVKFNQDLSIVMNFHKIAKINFDIFGKISFVWKILLRRFGMKWWQLIVTTSVYFQFTEISLSSNFQRIGHIVWVILGRVVSKVWNSYQTDAISSCCLQTFLIAASIALSITKRPLNLKIFASFELQINPIGPPAWCSNNGHKGWSLSRTSALEVALFQDTIGLVTSTHASFVCKIIGKSSDKNCLNLRELWKSPSQAKCFIR